LSGPPGHDSGGSAARFKARAGLLPVIGLIYASACGGPYGTENYVAETGPGLFLLLLFVAPWLWGVPTAFACAELSAARPVEGGYYVWTRDILGEFWGFQAGTWSLISSFLDNALYPVLFAQSLSYWVPGMSSLQRWLAAVAFIALLTFLNYLGIRIAGGVAVALTATLIAPLVWIVVAAIPRVHYNPFVPFTVGGTFTWAGFGSALALAIWFYSGYTEVSTAGEEIENPRRNIPRALLIVTPLVVLSYAAPTIAGLASVGGWQTWESGQFALIGAALGGPLLGGWAFLGSVCSFTVIFTAYVLWWSRLGWALAAHHRLPYFSRLHPRYGTPHRVLVLYAIGYSILAAVKFEDLLVFDVWVFGAYDLLLLIAVLRARYLFPAPAKGFRIPGGKVGVWINVIVPALTWIVVMCTTATRHVLAGATVILLVGPVLYLVLRRLRAIQPPAAAS